jgi:hypothetical protein
LFVIATNYDPGMAYFRVSQRGSLPLGDEWVSNFHILSSSTTNAVHTQAGSAIASFWNNTYKAMCHTATTLDSIVTTELDPNTGKNLNAQETGYAIAGALATAAYPPQTCVLVSYRTANAGKGGRGRQYFPAPAAAHGTLTGEFVPADRDAFDTAWTSVLTGLATVGTPIILHGGFFRDKVTDAPGYKPLSSDPITNVAVAGLFATQRRRTNKVGSSYSPFLAV